MKRLTALAFVAISIPAQADQFYVTVGLECNQSQSELVVSFSSAWNEAGEAAIANLSKNEWNPQDLVSFAQDSDGKYLIHIKNKIKRCRLGRHIYAVSVSPMLAPRFHPEGWCASRIGAAATVKEGQKILASAGTDACTETGDVVTRIVIRPNQAAQYTRVTARSFYGN